jgi:hypothetical protein
MAKRLYYRVLQCSIDIRGSGIGHIFLPIIIAVWIQLPNIFIAVTSFLDES